MKNIGCLKNSCVFGEIKDFKFFNDMIISVLQFNILYIYTKL